MKEEGAMGRGEWMTVQRMAVSLGYTLNKRTSTYARTYGLTPPLPPPQTKRYKSLVFVHKCA